MTFQASDTKGCNFMDLLDEISNPIKPYIAKDSLWLKFFDHSNSLCTRAIRTIINHAPIGEYQLRFFLWEEFKCLCGLYPIKSRYHILHKCRSFNTYQNPNRESIAYFTLFLEFNGSAFLFDDNTTQLGHKYNSFYSLFLYFTFLCFLLFIQYVYQCMQL